MAVSQGATVKVVQRMLGHASATMTPDVYAGLFDGDVDGVSDRLEAAHVYKKYQNAGVLPIWPGTKAI